MPEIAEDELRKERQVEAEEHQDRGELRPELPDTPAGHLRPPEMDAAEIGHHRAADHDVVEMRDDEVGVVNVHVDGQARPETARSGRRS